MDDSYKGRHEFTDSVVNGLCQHCGLPANDEVHYKPLRGFQVVHQFDPDEKIVGMVTFKEQIIVATDKWIYRLLGTGVLEPLELIREESKDGSKSD